MNLYQKLRKIFTAEEAPTNRFRIKVEHSKVNDPTMVIGQAFESNKWQNICSVAVVGHRDMAESIRIVKDKIEAYKATGVDQNGEVAL